jgi:hypothetical protein
MSVLLAAGLMWNTGEASAADPQAAAPQGGQAKPEMGQAKPEMAAMMKMREQMMAEMSAGDARLDALVKDMNSATGPAKITAMSATLIELVQQHKAMHDRMGHMQMMGGRGAMTRQ